MTFTDEKKTGNSFPWLILILGLAAMAVLLALGTWQVQRLHWKEALLATIEERTHQPPEPLVRIETLFAENAVQYRTTLSFLEGRINTIRRALKGE